MTIEELKKGEQEAIEYKRDIPAEKEKYLKTAVAFANAAGGRIVFGVENNTWDVTGFSDDEVFAKMDGITNSIFDACEPSVVPIMEIEEIDGKKIIVATIRPGMARPYYLRKDGMMEGTYIRIAGVTRKAEPYMIKELQLEGMGTSFDVAIGAAFQYMHIIEKWGTGIPRIFKEAKEYGLPEPELMDFGTSFRISIYRKDAETDVYGVVGHATENATKNATESATDATDATDAPDNATNGREEDQINRQKKYSKNELTLLHYVKGNPTATQKEVSDGTGITIGTVKRLFPSLQRKMALKRNGNHKEGSWEVLIKIPE